MEIKGDDDDHNCDQMNGEEEWRYMIVRPERARFGDLWRFWRKGYIKSGSRFIENNSSDNDQKKGYYEPLDIDDWRSLFDGKDNRWVIVVSVIVRKLIKFFGKPLEWFGYFIDFFLNLLYLNGNLLGLAFNALQGKVVIPERGTTKFISSIGHLDGRIELMNNIGGGESSDFGREIKNNRSSSIMMDLCIMASKLAYENENLVKEVVVSHWKMHFVGFYNGWNDYQQQKSTQVFIFCDKPVDANFILISFRGTEPYNAGDWSTDFDYSWYDIPHIGKLHVGFLEALGLGNRSDTPTFMQNLQNPKTIISKSTVSSSFSFSSSSSPEMAEFTAYNVVKTKLNELLQKHKKAEFIVTGHSLGGALAILFSTVLVIHEERAILRRLLGVYTFGQPRIGDEKLVRFIDDRINVPEVRYFRVVYCNDVVPRLPYDDKTFLYKHFGACLYYNCFYNEKEVDEEPNKNFLGIKYLIMAYMNAVWELMRALTMRYVYGVDYEEDWYSIMLRVVGLILPGISAHSPRDYVNSVRLRRS